MPGGNPRRFSMSNRKLSSVALAAAAAVMFTTVSATAGAQESTVKCEGVNACKGQSACNTATNSCKGLNSCKGKGYLLLSQDDCTQAKRNVAREKANPDPSKVKS
jgi:uncharacterized protein (DUF2141 family)